MRLYQMHYSPWSERARWALEHHHLSFEKVEHVPVLGVPLLRAVAKRPWGKITVPLLVAGDQSVQGSLEIARWAEEKGTGEPLFPPGQDEAIERWHQVGEGLLEAGRILVTRRVAGDREAQRESTPAFVPEGLRGAVAAGAGVVTGLLAQKYGFSGVDSSTARAQAREGLLALRAALPSGARHLIGERFSYADLLMAASLQFLRPVADLYMPIGPATRRCWSNPDLAEEFADLLAWRDQIFAEHRR
ncbi:MAG: glutathione S-transferase [Polyangiaceae bacterium]|jgi:glutathione S-transferase|nr:glutathione S-transferase [Polyangiaceae bacterium]